MARQRLTQETLGGVQRLAGAREHVRLAESILGPSATDNEVLATAKSLSHLSPEAARAINHRRASIAHQNRRIAAAPDGSEDPWDESGPDQPDPTNNQAYTKQIMTTPDHAVLDSLQKRDVHAPTAARARDLSRAARKKYRLAAEDEGGHLDDHEFDDGDEGEILDAEIGDEAADQVTDDMEMGGLDDELGDDLDMEDEVHDHDDEFDDELDMEDELDDDMDVGDLPDEEGLRLDEERGDLDDMLEMEDGELDEEEMEGAPDIFDDVDLDEEDLAANMDPGGAGAMAPGDAPAPMGSRQRRPASRQSRGRRVVQGNASQARRLASGGGGQGPSRISLDEILDVHDDDIERTASTPLEGDDLEALLGARVNRAGQRVATSSRPEQESPAARQRRAMLERVWDTENDPEMVSSRGGQRIRRPAQQQAAPQRRVAAPQKRRRPAQQQAYAPDRRRVSQHRNEGHEFDQVFGMDGMPDIRKFFD